MRVLGLMSGTSADGVDAVLAEFTGNPSKPKWKYLNIASVSYPNDLRQLVLDIGQGLKVSSKEWLNLSEEITGLHAQAGLACDPKGLAELIGCHGQTVWHSPPTAIHSGGSLQLLQGPLLAQLLNCPVIFDFRAADVVLGGHGAPLVPKMDAALFGAGKGWRAILNLGGIANLTFIPPENGPDQYAFVVGWDCGPANTLVDFAVHQITNGELTYDVNGLIAAQGHADELIIQRWIKEPFFQRNPPKSTGREQFGRRDLKHRMKGMANLTGEDVVATLTAFTAAVVANDLNNFYAAHKIRPVELLVSGGGCNNPIMLSELRKRCLGLRVVSVAELGIPVQAREALSFGLLAWWHVRKYPGNLPQVTGAKSSAVLGIRADPV